MKRVLLGAALGCLLLLACGFATYRLVTPRLNSLTRSILAQLDAGRIHLETGRTLLQKATADHDLATVKDAQGEFRAGANDFANARALADGSRLLRVSEAVPVFGSYVSRRHDAIRGVAETGRALADAGTQMAALDATLIQPSGQAGGGARLLEVLKEVQPQVQQLRAFLERARGWASAVDTQFLPAGSRASFAHVRATVVSGADGINEFERLVPILREILGGNGPRTYLIEQLNPAELRSGGGFIGTLSLVTADRGILKLVSSGPVEIFDRAQRHVGRGSSIYFTPPNTLTGFYQGDSWPLEDSNFFPEFATNATWGERFVQTLRNVHTDGVIAIDYYALADILKVTGPLPVPGFGITFTSANLADQVFERSFVGDPTHKAILAAAAVPLVAQLASLPADRWPLLVQAMNDAAAQRHLQAYFNDPTAEREMGRVGWSGGLNPGRTSDMLLETEDSMGGSKANHFMDRRYTVTLTEDGGVLHHRVVIDFQDNTPYVAYGPKYYAYVRLYTTDAASHLRLTAGPSPNRSTIPADYVNKDVPAGYRLADGWIFIDPWRSRRFRLVFQYDTAWTTDAAGSHDIYWQKQPGILADPVDITWTMSGKTFHARTDLGQDRVIDLAPNGIQVSTGEPATAHLPAVAL